MNADRLLAHYEQIADAPDAIVRLRRFILDLAVRGKLVPRVACDEPASELLRQIAREKARLVKAGEIRKLPSLQPMNDSEAPYVLPVTWAWVRVGDIFDYDAGTKRDPKELEQSRWLLELEDIEKDTSRIVERLRVSDRDSQSTKSEFEIGDILYGKLRPYLNKVVVADEPGYSTTEIVAIRPFLRLCPEYCALAFRRPLSPPTPHRAASRRRQGRRIDGFVRPTGGGAGKPRGGARPAGGGEPRPPQRARS
jgi:type I restriction enzyme, S subunit